MVVKLSYISYIYAIDIISCHCVEVKVDKSGYLNKGQKDDEDDDDEDDDATLVWQYQPLISSLLITIMDS